MLSIQTNISSLVAQENLRVISEFQGQTIQRVTSGFRINQAGDDAAGLVVANGYRSDIAELTQGVRNANYGVSTLQIIDGGLNNISKLLDRLRTLASQSASDTFAGSRDTLDAEYQDLVGEIDRQADNIGLGSTDNTYLDSLNVYIGGSTASVTVDLSNGGVDSGTLGLTKDITSAANAIDAIGEIKTAVDNLGVVQGTIGSSQNKLGYAIGLAESQIAGLSAAESRIRDADMASEAANLTKAQVLQQASLAAMAQANAAPQGVLALLKV